MSQDSQTPGKKTWEKPEVRAIPLNTEEVLAVGCKMRYGSTRNLGDKNNCGIVQGCQQDGS